MPLLYSFLKKQHAISKYLVLKGASTKGRTYDLWESRGYSIFHYAANKNCPKVLKALLKRQPKDFTDLKDDIHPMHLTVANSHDKCVKLMIDFACDGRFSLLFLQGQLLMNL